MTTECELNKKYFTKSIIYYTLVIHTNNNISNYDVLNLNFHFFLPILSHLK